MDRLALALLVWLLAVASAAAQFTIPTGAATEAAQINGTQKTQIVDNLGSIIHSTSNNLNVQCANCSGSGVSAADGASFTAGATLFAGGGGFFQTTPTNSPLINGQQGMFQVTANRALFSNLRNAAGAEVGTATTPLQVTGANGAFPVTGTVVATQPTGANLHVVCDSGCSGGSGGSTFGAAFPATGSATGMSQGGNLVAMNGIGGLLNVTGAGGTFPVTGTVTVNAGTNLNTSLLALETGGNLATINTNFGAPGSVACATDTASCSLNQQVQRLAQRLTTINTTLGTPLQAGGNIGNTTFAVTNAGTFAVQAILQTGANVIGSLTANQSVNVAQFNGVTPLMGNGIAGTGAQRVTIASDNTAFTVVATQPTGTNLHIVCDSGCSGSGGTSSTFGAAFPAAGTAVGMSQGGNMVALTGTTGNLNVQCANCSGSGVSAADEAAFTAGASLFAGGGGFFQTTATSNALTTGQQGMFQVTANRALFTNLRNAAGTEVGTAAAPLQVSVANTAANGTAMLVTGTGGTFPISGSLTANQSVNVSQINGVAPLMGNGVTGTGSQRVTIASDNTAFAVNATLQAGAAAVGTVNPTTAANWGIVAPATATGTQAGHLVQAVATTAAPAYTTATINQLSMTTGGGLRHDLSSVAGNTALTGNGVTGTGSQRVTIASDNTAFAVNATLQTGANVIGSLTANQSVNTAQINGVAPLMGNGVTGTGSQRVTIASDNTAFAVNATLQASSATAIGTVNPTTVGTWGLQVSTQNSATPTNGALVLGQFNTAPTTITTGNVSPLQMDSAGNLLVNIKAGAGSGGTAIADKAAWTVSSTTFTLTGGEFTTGGATACTTGQACTAGMTAARAFFTDLSSIAGATTLTGNGVTGAGSPRVTIASDNTAFSVNATLSAETTKVIGTVNQGTSPWVISGSLTANQSVNVAQVNGVTPLMGNGVTGTGSQRVTIASDNTAFSVNATLQASSATAIGTVNPTTAANWGIVAPATSTGTQAGVLAQAVATTAAPTYTTATINQLSMTTAGGLRHDFSSVAGTATLTGNGVTGAGSQRVTIASDNTAFAVNATLQTGANVIGSLTANQSVNTAQINGVAPLMGNGATGTGSQRVTIASDNTAFSVNATLQASAATAIGTVNPTTVGTWGLQVSTQNSATPTNGALVLGQFNTAPTTITTGNVSPLQMDSAGNLLVNIKAGAGSGGTAIADKAAWTVSSTTFTLTGGEFTTGGATACATAQACTVGMTAARAFFTDLSSVAGTATLTGNGVTGAGSPRVTIASDNTAFAVNATLQASSATAIGTVNPTTIGNWGLGASGQNVASPTNAMLVMGQFNTAPTTITTTNASPLQLDNAGNLLVNIKAGAGSGGTAIADKAAWTVSSTTFTLTGGEFTTGGATACTTGQACTVGMTAARAMFEDISSIAGTATLTGNGTTGAGSQRVTIASDNTAFSVNATLSAETTKVIGTVNQGTSPWVISGSLTANQSVNVAQINGVTPLMGNGVTGTGSQRVTIASDNTAFAVNATLQASSATAIGTVNPTTVGTWGLAASTQNVATPTNGMLVMGEFNTAPTTITTGNSSPLQLDTNGNLLVNIKAGAGSGGTAIADKAAWTVSSTTFTLSGGEFTTGGATACATGQACTVGMTAARGFFTDLSTINAVTVLTGTGAVGTGSQRVAVGTDTATIAGSAPGTAGTASANVVTVQGIAAMTKLLVTPDSVALPANQSVNVSQINAVTPLMGNGVTGTGSQRVTIASDNTAFSVNATLQTGANVIGALTANQSVNTAQVNGVTTLTGAGATGTGAQRVTVSQDTTTVAGTTPALMGVVAPGTATGTQGGVVNQAVATTAAPTYTTATINQLSMTTAGGLRSDLSSVGGGSVALGSAAAASSIPVVIASNQTAADPCMFQAKTNVTISTASGTTNLVTGVSAKKVYVCSIVIVAATAISVSLSEGSATLCATSSQAGVIGVATNGTAANGIALVANGGITLGNGGGTIASTATAANYLCLFQSGTAQISGNLTYVQQ